jgi:hypothetical protein
MIGDALFSFNGSFLKMLHPAFHFNKKTLLFNIPAFFPGESTGGLRTKTWDLKTKT